MPLSDTYAGGNAGDPFFGSLTSAQGTIPAALQQSQMQQLQASLAAQNWQAKKQFELGQLQSQNQLQAALGTAGLQSKASMFGAEKGAQASMFGSQQSAEAAKYGANQQLAGTQAEIAGQAARQQSLLNYKSGLLGQFMPLFQQSLSQLGSPGGSGGFSGGVGGMGGPGGYPEGGVYSPQQVSEQINSQQAQNDAKTATGIRQAESAAGARGMGPQSPLLDLVRAQMGAQGQAQNADVARQTTWDAGTANADAIARTRALNSQNWQAALQSDTTRRNALLAALSSIVGSASSVG